MKRSPINGPMGRPEHHNRRVRFLGGFDLRFIDPTLFRDGFIDTKPGERAEKALSRLDSSIE